ncbi:MAG: prephenate dehydratase domain-containing protein [Clostridiaceae bacterium]|nr:prephenate dehydratase domain-containing protein [Clostridiaceae bacterium]
MDLQEYRTKIDGIDREIVRLFSERMQTASEIAAYKKEHNLPVYDGAREHALLAKVSELAGENLESYTRVLFSTLMNLSRSYQIKTVCPTSALSRRVADAVENTPRLFPEKAIVACQGVEGAYSQAACEKIFTAPSILYMNTFDAVFRAVNAGLCRYGILPLENSTAGSVNQVYDLMSKYHFYIVRSVRCRISHCLLARPGVSLDNVREVYSHEQALNQCAAFFAEHKNIRPVACENTAVAAKTVAESDRSDIAAISSSSCAELYGLKSLSRDIQDNGGNDTRFICISKTLEVYPGADKTSVKLILPHRPGSLYHILARFYALGINISKLESRPIPGRDFEFMFYFDADASVYSPALTALLCELEAETEDFEYLGSYSEVV